MSKNRYIIFGVRVHECVRTQRIRSHGVLIYRFESIYVNLMTLYVLLDASWRRVHETSLVPVVYLVCLMTIIQGRS